MSDWADEEAGVIAEESDMVIPSHVKREIAASLRQARQDALEEAALQADGYAAVSECAERAAKAIRSLKDKPPKAC